MSRPTTLSEIAARANSLEDFGRHFQDWLHSVRAWTSRPPVAQAIKSEPTRLARRFAGGHIADAWLAAYAEYAARQVGLALPEWATGRVSPEPWFAVAGTDLRSRLAALRDSPAPFKSRNLYTPAAEWPLRLAAGRPAKSAEELRRAAAERQRRFRERRRLKLQQLWQAIQP